MKGGITTVLQILSLIWRLSSSGVKARLVLAGCLVCIGSGLAALGPFALKLTIDLLTKGAVTSTHLISLECLIGFYVSSQYLAGISGEIRGLVYARAETRMLRVLSECLYTHILRLPMHFHVNRQIGGITQSIANGQQGLQTVVHTLMFSILPVGVELVTVVFVVRKLQLPVAFGLFCCAIGCYALVFGYAAQSMMKAARLATEAQVAASSMMTDSLLNFEIVKSCAAEETMEKRASESLAHNERAWVEYYRQFTRNGILAQSINAAFRLATIIYAAYEFHGGGISIGTFVLLNTYMLQIVRPIEVLGFGIQSFTQGVANLGKSLDLLKELPEDLVTGDPSVVGPGNVVFEGVEACYRADRTILKDISFELPAGNTLAIVGASGSGKSTIGRLLTRLMEPTRGKILLDGAQISSIQLSHLRTLIAVVPQDVVLFNDTIAFNIAFGRPGCTRQEIEDAASLAHLREFIAKLQDGYETVVGERGLKLSGGEKQRIAIARAAINHPRIYLWDEATSSLDSASEKEILRNIEEIAANTTTIMIAHRLSTVVHADQIIVLDDGRIVERGTHASLLREGTHYAALWSAQQRGNEGTSRASSCL
jgi:ABC-type transport system involved in Fe-S cluster assembly fused permease/ATPase subunit